MEYTLQVCYGHSLNFASSKTSPPLASISLINADRSLAWCENNSLENYTTQGKQGLFFLPSQLETNWWNEKGGGLTEKIKKSHYHIQWKSLENRGFNHIDRYDSSWMDQTIC
jgi:hypothetical protein